MQKKKVKLKKKKIWKGTGKKYGNPLNFRLRMRAPGETPFWVTSLPVSPLPVDPPAWIHHKWGFVRAMHILLSSLTANVYQGNPDMNRKLWSTMSNEIYIQGTPYTGAAGTSLHINGKFPMGSCGFS